MFDGPAGDSFRYALNPELIKLYTTIIAGWVVIGFAEWFGGITGLPEPFETIVALPFLLLGLALFLGELVGVLHRVTADATA